MTDTDAGRSGMEELAGHYAGLRVITNPMLTIGPLEDWSGVRSHGRAIRRRKRGFRQNIRFYFTPDPSFYRMGDTVVGHPETVAHLKAHLQNQGNPSTGKGVEG